MAQYVSPFQLSSEQGIHVPESGTFTVPVCTTPERFKRIMDILWRESLYNAETTDFDHLIDWLEACTHITEGCEERNPVCETISIRSDRIEWFPESPFAPLPDVPDGYIFHPYTVVDSGTISNLISIWGLGYQVGDVYTDVSKFPIFTSWSDFVVNYANLPHFRLTLEGAGTIKLHLLNIPQGGRLLHFVDEQIGNILELGGIELDLDRTSYPAEKQIELIIPIELTEAGTHTIDFVFTPVVDLAFIPLFFGGGIRRIELCGFGVTNMPSENCCDEQLALTNKTNLLLDAMLTIMRNGFKIVPITDDLIDSITFGGCVPDHFDNDGSDPIEDVDRRTDTLCWVVQAYVYAVLFENLALIGFPVNSIISMWEFGVNEPFPLSKLQVNGSWLTAIVFTENIASMGTVLDAMTCTMVAALTGKTTSYAPFRDSVPASENPNPFVSAVYNMMYYANHQKDNFTLFSSILGSQFDDNNIPSGWTCPCAPEAPVAADCNDISLIDVEGTGCIIEYISDCIWKFTQPNVSLMAGISARHFSFRDANGLNLLVTVPSDTVTYPVTAVGGCEIVGVCASPDYHGYMFGGGFAPYELNKVMWWQGEAASNVTYYKVELASC